MSSSFGAIQKYVPVTPLHEKSPTDPGNGLSPECVLTANPSPKPSPSSCDGASAPKRTGVEGLRRVSGGRSSDFRSTTVVGETSLVPPTSPPLSSIWQKRP